MLTGGEVDLQLRLESRITKLEELLQSYYVGALLVAEYQQAAPFEGGQLFRNLKRYLREMIGSTMQKAGEQNYLFVEAIQGSLFLICASQSVLQEALEHASREIWEMLGMHSRVVISRRHQGEDELLSAYLESQGENTEPSGSMSQEGEEAALKKRLAMMREEMTGAIRAEEPIRIANQLRANVSILAKRHNEHPAAVAFLTEALKSIMTRILSKEDADRIGSVQSGAQTVEALRNQCSAVAAILNAYNMNQLRRRAEKLVEQTKERIDECLSEVTQESIALDAGVSAIYLSVVFKEITGESFKDYLIARKIEKAKKLLEDTPLKVGEIARMVGYYDSKYFSRLFRRFTGFNPQEYRKNRQQ